MALLRIKRGSTFRLRLRMETGLKGWTFTSHAVDGLNLQHLNPLTCREIDVDGACVVEIECPTDNWPLSIVAIDVRAERGGEVVLSGTIPISVLREVTHGRP